MIFVDLSTTFSKIGIVNFGGGYAMLSLIQDEVVVQHQWLSTQEFTDIVAVSQMTPGPIGINVATYVGYKAVVEAGYSPMMGVLGSSIATVSVVWLPFVVMLFLSSLLRRYKESPQLKGVFKILRPTVVGLVLAAAFSLMTKDNFGSLSETPYQFVGSLSLFVVAFILSFWCKRSPLLIIALAGLVGLVLYVLGIS